MRLGVVETCRACPDQPAALAALQVIKVRTENLKNREHFARLIAFCQPVLTICAELEITPVLSGSLAVFGYTQDRAIAVNDIDLACSEHEFPRLSRALEAKGIPHVLREWHVLQARRDDLKVEFDAQEYWFVGLPAGYARLVVAGCAFKVVSLPALRALYHRGLEATAGQNDEANRAKRAALAVKYERLCSV